MIVAAPVAAAALIWLAVLTAAGVTGTHPIWNLTPRNVAEAAALRDPAAVVRLIEAGSDANEPGEVRARVVLDETATLTPVEAAAAAREREMVQLLFDMGASPDANVWHRAYCISNADSVREVLESHRPAGAIEHCPEK